MANDTLSEKPKAKRRVRKSRAEPLPTRVVGPCPDTQGADVAAAVGLNERETEKLLALLVEANSLLRTTAQIVGRKGEHTNWSGFETKLLPALERERVAINEFNGYFDPKYRRQAYGF
jgi:hypothetical protein